jgi:HK97 family phage major capsid protein
MKKKLVEARALAFKKADDLANLAEGDEARSLTTEEMETMRTLHIEIEDLDKQIEVVTKQDELRAATAIEVPAVHGTNRSQDLAERKIIKRYNILKALRSLVDPKAAPLAGVELEIDQEARKEQRECGVSHLVQSGINVPSFAMREEQRADEQVVNPDVQGGFTVGRDLVEVIGILRPRTAIRAAGANLLTGLVGNLDFTTQDTGAVTNWAAEIATSDQASQTYTQASMSPKRLAAWTPVSLQLLAQSSIDMQQFVINDLNDAMNESIEQAAFSGTGIAPVPQGLLGEVPELGIGDNGGAFTFDHAVDMETVLQVAETARGSMAYIMNSQTYGTIKQERLDAGSGILVIAQGQFTLNGYPVYVSNLLPNNLNKGTVVDDSLSAAILGNWSDLLIGNWGGANIIVDPYTSAKEGMINIVTNTFWDMLARRLTSFVSTSDIVTKPIVTT